MKPDDLETVQRMFEVVAPTAAAEMKSRVLAVLRQRRLCCEMGTLEHHALHNAILEIELLPLSKEATT